jgi:hypothetical protein
MGQCKSFVGHWDVETMPRLEPSEGPASLSCEKVAVGTSSEETLGAVAAIVVQQQLLCDLPLLAFIPALDQLSVPWRDCWRGPRRMGTRGAPQRPTP